MNEDNNNIENKEINIDVTANTADLDKLNKNISDLKTNIDVINNSNGMNKITDSISKDTDRIVSSGSKLGSGDINKSIQRIIKDVSSLNSELSRGVGDIQKYFNAFGSIKSGLSKIKDAKGSGSGSMKDLLGNVAVNLISGDVKSGATAGATTGATTGAGVASAGATGAGAAGGAAGVAAAAGPAIIVVAVAVALKMATKKLLEFNKQVRQVKDKVGTSFKFIGDNIKDTNKALDKMSNHDFKSLIGALNTMKNISAEAKFTGVSRDDAQKIANISASWSDILLKAYNYEKSMKDVGGQIESYLSGDMGALKDLGIGGEDAFKGWMLQVQGIDLYNGKITEANEYKYRALFLDMQLKSLQGENIKSGVTFNEVLNNTNKRWSETGDKLKGIITGFLRLNKIVEFFSKLWNGISRAIGHAVDKLYEFGVARGWIERSNNLMNKQSKELEDQNIKWTQQSQIIKEVKGQLLGFERLNVLTPLNTDNVNLDDLSLDSLNDVSGGLNEDAFDFDDVATKSKGLLKSMQDGIMNLLKNSKGASRAIYDALVGDWEAVDTYFDAHPVKASLYAPDMILIATLRGDYDVAKRWIEEHPITGSFTIPFAATIAAFKGDYEAVDLFVEGHPLAAVFTLPFTSIIAAFKGDWEQVFDWLHNMPLVGQLLMDGPLQTIAVFRGDYDELTQLINENPLIAAMKAPALLTLALLKGEVTDFFKAWGNSYIVIGIKDTFKEWWNSITSWWRNVKNWFSNNPITVSVKELFTGRSNSKSGGGGSYRRYAAGGVTTRAHLGIVGEAGPEAILPLRTSTYRNLAHHINAESGGRYSNTNNATINVGTFIGDDYALNKFATILKQKLDALESDWGDTSYGTI